MKTYEVLISAFAVVVVEDAKSEEEAMEIAMDQVSFGDFEHDETEIRSELKTDEDIERAKRFANAVALKE